MRLLLAVAPICLFLLIGVLHVKAIMNPSSAPMSFYYSAVFGLVFMLIFSLPQSLDRAGKKMNVLTIHAAHLHLPRSIALLAYCLLGMALCLLVLSQLTDFDPRRGSTAFWLVTLACPSVVWLHCRLRFPSESAPNQLR